MADIRAGDLDNLPDFGLVLCNDFTVRLTLIKDIDLSEPIGLTVFATAMSCTDCLPTGFIVVIPRSAEFYLSLMLSLYVNDALGRASIWQTSCFLLNLSSGNRLRPGTYNISGGRIKFLYYLRGL